MRFYKKIVNLFSISKIVNSDVKNRLTNFDIG